MNHDQPRMLKRTRYLEYFQQHGAIYAHHQRIGFIIGMSRDLVDLLEFHAVTVRTRDEVDERFHGQFEKEQLDEFIQTLEVFGCLVESELEEDRKQWRMVPVRARWVLFNQPTPEQVTFWRTDRHGGSHSETPPAWAARLWDGINGFRTLEELYAQVQDDPTLAESVAAHEGDDPRTLVSDLVSSWVHSDRQYLRMAAAPVSKFGPEHQWPSYLRSSMPFAPWVPGKDPDPVDVLEALAQPIAPPHDYYESEVEDAEEQFRNVETTLSHLFRDPHPLLDGGTYASRLVDALAVRGAIGPATRQIVEVGGGLGSVAAGVLTTIRSDHPEIFANLAYTIVDLSPALRAKQAETLEAAGVADKVAWVAANAETHQFEPNSIDLLLSNEVVGDFTVVKLSMNLLGLDGADDPLEVIEDWSEELCERLGESGRVIQSYGLPLRDAAEEFYLNVGAIQFLEQVAKGLRPGGWLYISEYGDLVKWPVPSTHLDHIEFSTHFGLLQHVARFLGLRGGVEYVQDIIQIDRDPKTLATTRSWFASMRAMLADAGIDFDKRAYTRAMFEELLGDKLPLSQIGDVRFRPVDERCMGLSPHEFKALIAQKPA